MVVRRRCFVVCVGATLSSSELDADAHPAITASKTRALLNMDALKRAARQAMRTQFPLHSNPCCTLHPAICCRIPTAASEWMGSKAAPPRVVGADRKRSLWAETELGP